MDKLKALFKALGIEVDAQYFSEDQQVLAALNPTEDSKAILTGLTNRFTPSSFDDLPEELRTSISKFEAGKARQSFKKMISDKAGLTLSDNERRDKKIEELIGLALEAQSKEGAVKPEDYQALQRELQEAKNARDQAVAKFNEIDLEQIKKEAITANDSKWGSKLFLQSVAGKVAPGTDPGAIASLLTMMFSEFGSIGKDASGKYALLDKEDAQKLAMIDGKEVDIEEKATAYLQGIGIVKANDFPDPNPVEVGGGADYHIPDEKPAI